MTEDEVLAAVTQYADAERGPASADEDWEELAELALVQLQAPFECWKFGGLCESVGPVEATSLVASFWDAVMRRTPSDSLVETTAEAMALAEESYPGEYLLSPEDEAQYRDLVDDGFRTVMALTCGPDTDDRTPSTGSTYTRSVSGVTNLALYKRGWTNVRHYEAGSNVKADICVISGWSEAFVQIGEDQYMASSVAYDVPKCKTKQKVSEGVDWWGSSFVAVGAEGCVTGPSGFICSCRGSNL